MAVRTDRSKIVHRVDLVLGLGDRELIEMMHVDEAQTERTVDITEVGTKDSAAGPSSLETLRSSASVTLVPVRHDPSHPTIDVNVTLLW